MTKIRQQEISLSNLTDQEALILKGVILNEINSIKGTLFGAWISEEEIPAEICQLDQTDNSLQVQLKIYADRYCKGIQLCLVQKGNDIYGKIDWAKGTRRRSDRTDKIENLLRHDWNDTTDADVANLDSNIPIGEKGYGLGKIVLELAEQEPIAEKKPEAIKPIEPIEPKQRMVVEKKQNSVERKNENVQQIPAATCGKWDTLSNTIGNNTLRIEIPDFFRELNTASKKQILIDAIQKAANDLDKDEFEEPSECVRFLRNLSKISSQTSIDYEKTIFTLVGWKKVFREDVGYVETTLMPTEKTSGMAECQSLGEIPFDYDSEMGMYGVKLFKDSGHKCDYCKGNKYIRCPNCDGSGREQYVDGYFANGEERIKTGQCHVCYGKGMIECEHCDGTGLKDKGTGCYMGYNGFKQKFESKLEGLYINKWFVGYLNRRHPDRFFFAPDIPDGNIVILKENMDKSIIDRRKEICDEFLETFGYEYAQMFDRLQKDIDVEKNRKTKNSDENGWFLIKMSQSFSMYDSYRLSYNVDGEERNFLIVTDGNHSVAYWDDLPEMGIFGNIKKNR